MRTIQDIPDLQNKKVLLRTDFDVPVGEDGVIRESFRILRQKPTIEYLLDRGAYVVMMAHISAEQSFRGLVPQLQDLLGRPIVFIEKGEHVSSRLESAGQLFLMENIRQNPGEKANDAGFAQALAAGFDCYVNNAFAVCHRNHASVVAITQFLPSYAGLLIQEETERLREVLNAPALGKVIVMGGAKASTKIPVIRNLVSRADLVMTGGVIANDILKMRGEDVGDSIVDEGLKEIFQGIDLSNEKIVVPIDFNISENKFLDIGSKTIQKYEDQIRHAKMAIWNGPMGMFEDERFARGSDAMARAIVESGALSILGGGDTIAAVSRTGLLDKFNFVSTGGGAMMAFLAGQELPGLRALE